MRVWMRDAWPAARAVLADPEQRARWLRHGATWFVGVNALDNDAAGSVAGGPALAGRAADAALAHAGALNWDRAQISAVLPGYPGRDPGESDGAHRFRRDRAAAHVDGLVPMGPARRRVPAERHALILGIALTEADPGAAPLTVWEGSHHLIRAALARVLSGREPARWHAADVTAAYHAARRAAFARCRRVTLPAAPGEAMLLHRFTLHGIAPWTAGARADHAGRVVAYFRPDWPGAAEAWLSAP